MQNSRNDNADYMEDLFKQLRRLPPYELRDSAMCAAPFDDETIKGWYQAREYVLKRFGRDTKMGAGGIPPSSADHIHVVIHYKGNPMALYVARQVALTAHFPNFNESTSENRTVISILYNRNTHPDIIHVLKRQEYLCNLPDECKCVFVDGKRREVVRENSYIDIELELVGFGSDEFEYDADGSVVIDADELNVMACTNSVQSLDVCKARRVNMVYNVGADIDNLPPDDPNAAERYGKALFYFCYQLSPDATKDAWQKLCCANAVDSLAYQINLRNKLSNVFCADCFATRLKSVCNDFETLLQKDEKKLMDKVQANIQVLAQCEHARWNVEKLILGFSPLTPEERWEYAQRFGASRDSYRKKLKNKGHHIDLCSYQDLRRTDPGNMKYDCFLMLAMVKIVREDVD